MRKIDDNEGVRVAVMIGDDDSTAIKHVCDNDDSNEKWSDLNHAKKTLGSKLYDLKKSHHQLSEKVIKAIQKD